MLGYFISQSKSVCFTRGDAHRELSKTPLKDTENSLKKALHGRCLATKRYNTIQYNRNHKTKKVRKSICLKL